MGSFCQKMKSDGVMKVLKNILRFILCTTVIAALLLVSCIGWGFLVLIQTPGGLFSPSPIPLFWKIFDLAILLPINIGLIVLATVLLSRIGADKTTEKKSFWRKAARPAAIIAVSVVISSFILMKDTIKSEIEYKIENDLVNDYVEQADEIVPYENSGDLNDGLFDTQLNRSSALLDYDRMTVTFLYTGSWDRYNRVELLENGFVPDDSHILQFKNPLKDGGEFRVYYDKKYDARIRPSVCSCAVTVERNGKVYGAHFEPVDMEFESCLEDVYTLEERGLEALPYHTNEMLPYAGGIKSDTIFIDYENKKLHLVYVDDSGFRVRRVCCDEIDLTETDKVEGVFLQAEFELESGGKLYAYGNENYTKYVGDPILEWRTKNTDGLVIEYDGKLYCTEINTNRNLYDFLHSTGAVKVCKGWGIG